MSTKQIGDRGEALAAAFLEEEGYIILARNYRFGRREVDLVVRRNDLVAFVEVKARSAPGFGHPLEAITRLKRREVEAVATHFLATRGLDGVDVRFDAVAVYFRSDSPRAAVEHVEDAWRPGWT